jgi:phage terminase large subunit-like protein
MNANAEIKGEKMRIVKRAEYMKIDLTVALSMAAYEALRLNL